MASYSLNLAVILFLRASVSAFADPLPSSRLYQTVKQKSGNTEFSYNTGTAYRSEQVNSDGTIVGQYSLIDPNGHLRTVKYRAGPNGFEAFGDIGVDEETAKQASRLRALVAPKKPVKQKTSALLERMRKSPSRRLPSIRNPNRQYGEYPGDGTLRKIRVRNNGRPILTNRQDLRVTDDRSKTDEPVFIEIYDDDDDRHGRSFLDERSDRIYRRRTTELVSPDVAESYAGEQQPRLDYSGDENEDDVAEPYPEGSSYHAVTPSQTFYQHPHDGFYYTVNY